MKNMLSSQLTTLPLLESLAHIEYTGAKWILAVPASHWQAELHGHVSDELEHMRLMQEQAKAILLALGPQDMSNGLHASKACVEHTQKYLKKLMHKTYRLTLATASVREEPFLLYGALSFLIERRLMKIYPHIAAHGPSPELRECAKKLIADERDHLTAVKAHFMRYFREVEDQALVDSYLTMEQELAADWMTQLDQALSSLVPRRVRVSA